MYQGTFTALVTPFTADNQVDTAAFRQLIDFQFDNGVTGIVPTGTTGESPTLTHEEHRRVIALAVEYARGRGPVIGATGVVSVASNIIPREMSDLVNAALAGDFTTARTVHCRCYPLMSAFLKLDTNPVPIKTAMALKGMMRGDLRLPLVGMNAEKQGELRAVMAQLGLVK